jgi:hypothetical protein
MLALYGCAAIVVVLLMLSTGFWHWFILPVLVCGVLIGSDAVDWLRGRTAIFDPVGLLGLLGFHFYFLAPLLHVYWSFWIRNVVPPPDWRDWLAGMASLNVIGLSLYRLTLHVVAGRSGRLSTHWRLEPRLFWTWAGAAVLISAAAQAGVYLHYGGVSGYSQAFIDNLLNRTGTFENMGSVFAVSESLPIVAAMMLAVAATKKRWMRSWLVIGAMLLLFVGAKFLFGGLRGSRANTILGVFWTLGLIHHFVRPLTRKAILALAAAGLVFMYFYAFYKSVGPQVMSYLIRPNGESELVESTGRSLQLMILGDLGRSDTQALLLYRLTTGHEYEYALGRTYLGTAALLVPRMVWPDRPPSKVKEGTEALFGHGFYVAGLWAASQVYGLAGEAMLNFGPLAIPATFVILGLVVGGLKLFQARLAFDDSRWLILPLACYLGVVLIAYDSDNILWFAVKEGAIPLLVVVLTSVRAKAQPAGA